MASREEYRIPPRLLDRAREQAYEAYRARMEELARQREQVIEVEARRVEVEAAPQSTRRRRTTADGGAGTAGLRSGQSGPAQAAPATADSVFMYEPGGKAGGIDLKMSPYQRGLFVDITV